MKTVVVHCREPYDVYVGRPSKWGNPYSHKEGTLAKYKTRTRKEAIDKYEQYLLDNEELMNDLHELQGKVIACWCKPLPCHGDILAKYANSLGSKLF